MEREWTTTDELLNEVIEGGTEVRLNADRLIERFPSGGITIFDVTDFDDPQQIAEIEAEDRNDGIFADASHNFDVTSNRLYTSWYDAGARVYDITDPTNPERTCEYDPDGSSFWTAVRERGFVVSDIGGGLVFLHGDRGKPGTPGFHGADSVPNREPSR